MEEVIDKEYELMKLKAEAYDLSAQLQETQIKLQQVNQEIAKLIKENEGRQ